MKLDKHFKDIWNSARQRFCPVVSCSMSKLSFSVVGLLSCSLLLALCLSRTLFFRAVYWAFLSH